MKESLKSKTLKGMLWSSLERFSVQGVQFIVTLVIARVLDPKDFGLVGMLVIFLAVAQSLIDSGFSQALIRKTDRTEVDNSTVFIFNIIVSIFLYLLLYAIAPWVAFFYEEPALIILMRVLCFIIVINSLSVVQRALYTATVDFKTQAKASFIATVLSGGIGVYMALKGFGVWTLVWQQLLNAAFNTFLLWVYSSWRPHLIFSRKSFWEMFTFGSKLMVSGLIDTLYNNITALIIGKVFNAVNLGHYAQADRFAKFPSSNITGILQRVIYPVFCHIQDDDERLRNDYRKLLRVSAFIIFPLMCLLAGVSSPLIGVILGDKWHFAALLIIPLCFNMMWYPIHAINLNLLQVKGRSDLFLKLEIVKKTISITLLVCSIPFGVMGMCYIGIVQSLIALVINTYYTGKLINVGFLLQMRDLMGTLSLSLFMFVVVSFSIHLYNNQIVQLVLGSILGGFVFVGGSCLLKFKEVFYVKEIL